MEDSIRQRVHEILSDKIAMGAGVSAGAKTLKHKRAYRGKDEWVRVSIHLHPRATVERAKKAKLEAENKASAKGKQLTLPKKKKSAVSTVKSTPKHTIKTSSAAYKEPTAAIKKVKKPKKIKPAVIETPASLSKIKLALPVPYGEMPKLVAPKRYRKMKAAPTWVAESAEIQEQLRRDIQAYEPNYTLTDLVCQLRGNKSEACKARMPKEVKAYLAARGLIRDIKGVEKQMPSRRPEKKVREREPMMSRDQARELFSARSAQVRSLMQANPKMDRKTAWAHVMKAQGQGVVLY